MRRLWRAYGGRRGGDAGGALPPGKLLPEPKRRCRTICKGRKVRSLTRGTGRTWLMMEVVTQPAAQLGRWDSGVRAAQLGESLQESKSDGGSAGAAQPTLEARDDMQRETPLPSLGGGGAQRETLLPSLNGRGTSEQTLLPSLGGGGMQAQTPPSSLGAWGPGAHRAFFPRTLNRVVVVLQLLAATIGASRMRRGCLLHHTARLALRFF